jgi:hypothetical protein
MRIRIHNKHWNVRFVSEAELGRDYGSCDPPHVRGKQIAVRDDLRGRELVDTIIHESLHAGAWHQLDEAFIERLATDVSKLLWRPEVLARLVDDDEVRQACEHRAAEPTCACSSGER